MFLLPTGSDDLLTADKWGVGPTAVALKQSGPWTFGLLANHIWSVAGDDDRSDLSNSFVQPFFTYTTPGALSFTFTSESTYDWKAEDGAIPLNFVTTRVARAGGQMLNYGGGVRYWAESTKNGPDGWGVRLVLTFLFPK